VRPTTCGLSLLLAFFFAYCTVAPYHAGIRLDRPKPAATVVHR
jgi:hypothetical protein